MKRIIKITDCESGKELEMAEGDKLSCSDYFYYEKDTCPNEFNCTDLIFKEVKKEEMK